MGGHKKSYGHCHRGKALPCDELGETVDYAGQKRQVEGADVEEGLTGDSLAHRRAFLACVCGTSRLVVSGFVFDASLAVILVIVIVVFVIILSTPPGRLGGSAVPT